MEDDPPTPQGTAPDSRRRQTLLRVILGPVVLTAFFAGFFGAAGGFDWVRGWIYLGLLTAGQTLNTLIVARVNPELLRRRGTFGKGTPRWDAILLTLFGLTYLAVLIVAALDARLAWSTIRPSWFAWLAGLGLLGIYVFLLTWSMRTNPHFEKTVRIQADRDHLVIDSGPYRFVRHPGYLGTILGLLLSAPLLLDSAWAFIPAAVSAACLVIRTALEDRMLQAQLPGYADYAQRVRHRLLPGIW